MSKIQTKAREAQEVLESPVFKEAVAALEQEACKAFLAAPQEGDAVTERRWQVQGVQDVVRKLQGFVIDAKIEKSKREKGSAPL